MCASFVDGLNGSLGPREVNLRRNAALIKYRQ